MLDIGAGDAPYRELFDRCEYVTVDWANSPHEDASGVDIAASVDDLPIEDGSFDAVLCTQVLEHVATPVDVLREAHRVLRVGGTLLVTVPFVWEEHEKPFDFQRFSSSGVSHALESAGLRRHHRDGPGTTTSRRSRSSCGTRAGRSGEHRTASIRSARTSASLLDGLAEQLTDLAPLDVERVFPLGWEATAWRR